MIKNGPMVATMRIQPPSFMRELGMEKAKISVFQKNCTDRKVMTDNANVIKSGVMLLSFFIFIVSNFEIRSNHSLLYTILFCKALHYWHSINWGHNDSEQDFC